MTLPTEIQAGLTYVATASAFDVHHNPTALPGPVDWSSATFSVTAQPDGSCTFMCEQMGKFKLSARSGDAAADVDLTVVPGPAAYLEVTIVPFGPTAGGRER